MNRKQAIVKKLNAKIREYALWSRNMLWVAKSEMPFPNFSINANGQFQRGKANAYQLVVKDLISLRQKVQMGKVVF